MSTTSNVSTVTSNTTAQQFWGLGSGMSNIPEIIDAMLSSDTNKLTNYKNNITTLTNKKNAWEDIKNSIESINTIISNLSGFDKNTFKAATSGDTSYFTASATSNAIDMNYNINISTIAKAQIISSSKQADIAAALNLTGTFQIDGGTVTVDATDSLKSIMNKINSATDGSGNAINARAYIIDGNLFVESKKTGLSNTLSLNDTNGILASLGLIDSGTGLANIAQDAQNATFTINNVSIERESNTISDAVDGVTINLLKPASGDISLTVGEDTTKVKDMVNNLVKSINSLFGKLSTYSKYDSSTNTAALLNGDSTISDIKYKIIDTLESQFTGGGEYGYLFEIGISIDRYGNFSVDDDKLASALTKSTTDVVSMLTKGLENVSTLSGTDKGMLVNIKNVLKPFVNGISNIISNKEATYDSAIDRYNDLITEQTDYITKRKKALENEFKAMERIMSSLSSQSSYLTNVSNMYSNSSSS